MTPSKLTAAQIKKMIPGRPADSHKGKSGHVLIVAGSRGMSGAAVLVARGALRIGAGLVTVATVESERSVITHQLPEALTLPLPETPEGHLNERAYPLIEHYFASRDVNTLVVGPGLSVHADVARFVKTILKARTIPMLLDADGLNNVSPEDVKRYPDLVITPHPGELARFLKVETAVIQKERARITQSTAADLELVCVLKGQGSLISDGRQTRINPTGNPAMATGGMGDILSGVIGGLIAQGLPIFEAACAGVYLHGLAADLARVSDRGLLASEVADAIPRGLQKISIR